MRRILLAVAALLGAAVVASAATVPYRTDAELIAISAASSAAASSTA